MQRIKEKTADGNKPGSKHSPQGEVGSLTIEYGSLGFLNPVRQVTPIREKKETP